MTSELHLNIPVRRVENTYILYTKVFRTQEKRGIYVPSGAYNDTVLITTFERKKSCYDLNKSEKTITGGKISYVEFFRDSLRSA
jgi:hypothetical protein